MHGQALTRGMAAAGITTWAAWHMSLWAEPCSSRAPSSRHPVIAAQQAVLVQHTHSPPALPVEQPAQAWQQVKEGGSCPPHSHQVAAMQQLQASIDRLRQQLGQGSRRSDGEQGSGPQAGQELRASRVAAAEAPQADQKPHDAAGACKEECQPARAAAYEFRDCAADRRATWPQEPVCSPQRQAWSPDRYAGPSLTVCKC